METAQYVNPNYIYTTEDLDRFFEDDEECFTIREWLMMGIENGYIDISVNDIDTLTNVQINEMISWIDYLEDK